MGNEAIERVHENVYRIAAPLQGVETQAYLVLGEQVALVDTCTADSVPLQIEPALRSLGLGLGSVDIIVNTHPHWDHAGGNGRIRAAGRAQVMLHEADRPFTAEPEGFLSSEFDVGRLARMIRREDLVAARRTLLEYNLGPRIQVDRWLAAGDEIDLGRGVVLQVLHTPGHTAGSISLYWQREEMLFTGDSAQGRGTAPGGLPFYFHATDYISTLSRLKELPLATLCLGHGFHGGGFYNPPVRRGRAAGEMLADGLAVAELIDTAVGGALAAGAQPRNILEFARVALGLLQYDLPVQFDRDTGVGLQTLATINAHVERRSSPLSR